MPVMHILRGIPGSGKSTLRTELKLPYVNRDEIREVHPEWAEKEVIKHENSRIQQFMVDGIDFVVDNTHVHEKRVNALQQTAKQNGYATQIHELRTSLTECIMRDQARLSRGERGTGRHVILKMACDIGWYTDDPHWSLYPTRAVIFDIDGTLANLAHRRHLVAEKPKKWNEFYALQHLDTVYPEIKELFHVMQGSGYTVLCCSGRPEDYRATTEQWLEKQGLYPSWLLMRPFNDKRDDFIVKEELYVNYIFPRFDVRFVVDDRSSVVQMWRRLGLKCLQCEEGNF